jgi:hypothetical protein
LSSDDSNDSVVVVKRANCLTNNLFESESLPQIRNLLEMSEINSAGLKLKSGVENEADDEGALTIGGGYGGPLSKSKQEGKAHDSE